MLNQDKKYLFLILLHIVIGALLYGNEILPKIYGYSVILGGILYIINSKNKNNEVLYATAYMVGSEIILRMTDGNPVYEFSKFGVMIFILVGVYYQGISKNAIPYWIFLLLLIPSVVLTSMELNYTISLRKEISFNVSGPACLGICALYTYSRRVTIEQLNNIILCIGLPIISCVTYLTIVTPNLKDIIMGTESNFLTSGGFGPNQVSTMLGLGMFIFASRLMLLSSTLLQLSINLILTMCIVYRGFITFSRGGMITGFTMIFVLIIVSYVFIDNKKKMRMLGMIAFILIAFVGAWFYSTEQTNGLIQKRYANQDSAGRVKEDQFTGRGDLARGEIDTFLEYPIFGIGVGRTMEKRFTKTGVIITSHSEITRMIAEHGSLGILGLMILFATPLILYVDNKYNIYLLCFLIFWLLTINHAAMRLAAPAFLYSLALLKVVKNKVELIEKYS
jgi:hypothetical protein